MKMEYNIRVLRGWPLDGAMERVETIKAGVTLQNGDWVEKQSDNTVDKVGSTKTNKAGVVVSGNGDSASAQYTGKCVVLWGNFIAQIKNLPGAVTFVPKAGVTVQNGLIQLDAGSDPQVGHVLDVIAASATNDASIVVYIR